MGLLKNNLIMAVHMKETGSIVSMKEKEGINSPMGMFMRDSSKMGKQMGTVCIQEQKDSCTEGSGKMISKMEEGSSTLITFFDTLGAL